MLAGVLARKYVSNDGDLAFLSASRHFLGIESLGLTQRVFEELALTRPMHQTLYRDRGEDFARAVLHLAGAQDSFYIKLTGGCLYWNSRDTGIYEVLLKALEPYSGALGVGASRSTHLLSPDVIRPSIPEIGPLFEKQNPQARVLGMLPGAGLWLQEESNQVVVCTDECEGEPWRIVLHPDQRHTVLASDPTEYTWFAEDYLNHRIIRALDAERPLRGAVLISYDGGVGTRAEIENWERLDPRRGKARVLLIAGSDPQRTTDSLASDSEWLATHPNVEVVQPSAELIHERLRQLQAFTGLTRQTVMESSNYKF